MYTAAYVRLHWKPLIHFLQEPCYCIHYSVAGKETRFYFKVKFYAIDPSVLQDNTRYQFFLQLKNDIANGRYADTDLILIFMLF